MRSAGGYFSTCELKTCPADYWDTLHSKFVAKWSDARTGQHMKMLVAEYAAGGSDMNAYWKLQDGVQFAKERCPESNQPWLDKFLQEVKADVVRRLRARDM